MPWLLLAVIIAENWLYKIKNQETEVGDFKTNSKINPFEIKELVFFLIIVIVIIVIKELDLLSKLT